MFYSVRNEYKGRVTITNVQKGIVSNGMSGRGSVDFDSIPEHAFLLCAPGRRIHSSADISKD